jgi:hypothetical protein
MSRAKGVVVAALLTVGLGQVATTARGQAPTPNIVPAPTTLWNRMGIPNGFQKLRDSMTNRSGNRPGMERKPPLKRIGDPQNLMSKNPAIKTAAEIKNEEDLKKQKIKAIKYLASIGCGCYPGVKEALLAALDDCTEAVRLEAAKAFTTAAGNKCNVCSRTCCDNDVRTKLAEIAYELDDHGCFKESSAEVRQAALQALRACCGAPYIPGAVPESVPTPQREVPLTPEPEVPGVPTPAPQPEPTSATMIVPNSMHEVAQGRPATRRPALFDTEAAQSRVVQSHPAEPRVAQRRMVEPRVIGTPVAETTVIESQPVEAAEVEATSIEAPEAAETAQPQQEVPGTLPAETPAVPLTNDAVSNESSVEAATETVIEATQVAEAVQAALPQAVDSIFDGSIAEIDAEAGYVQLALRLRGATPHIGQRVRVYQQQATRRVRLGELEIVHNEAGTVIARPLSGLDLAQVSKDDAVMVLSTKATNVASRTSYLAR